VNFFIRSREAVMLLIIICPAPTFVRKSFDYASEVSFTKLGIILEKVHVKYKE
jgi:hypothetical protein